jgi:hypothetical protein
MQLRGFLATMYNVVVEHDGELYEVSMPWNNFSYDHIQLAVFEKFGVALPHVAQEAFGAMVSRFIASSIARGESTVGPLAIVNRIAVASPDYRAH